MLVIHIGPHKTATSSIQGYLARNRKLLKQAGWTYPVIAGGDVPDAQHEIARAPDRYLPPDSEGHGQLKALAATGDNLVLSAEAFRIWPAARFDRLADILGAGNYDLVYAVRDPLALFWSYWSEEVKQGRAISLPERFAEVFTRPLGNPLLNPLIDISRCRESARANLRVIPFDVLAADRVDISSHLLKTALGVDPTGFATQAPTNTRFPVELTELLRAITLVRGKGQRNLGPEFRLRFMEAVRGSERAGMVATIEREGRAALRTVRFPERPEFVNVLQRRLKQHLGDSWTYDVAGRDLFPDSKLQSHCYNAAALLEVPQIRALVDEVIARVEPLLAN